jgi:hypothetical protein
MSMSLRPIKSEAEQFLHVLDPGGQFTFQTFDDNENGSAKVCHGSGVIISLRAT